MKNVLFYFVCTTISLQLSAQDDNLDRIEFSKDTLFVLLDATTSAVELGTHYAKPDQPYPLDIGRLYTLRNVQFLDFREYYTMQNSDEIFYFHEPKEKFLRREYLNSAWFDDKSYDQLNEAIDGNVLMVVDPNYALNDNYCVVRVLRNKGVE